MEQKILPAYLTILAWVAEGKHFINSLILALLYKTWFKVEVA